MLGKIISGGQTGADIAGVDAAIACGIPYGGTIPKCRKCETGSIPDTYTSFEESGSSDYNLRTEINVADSDGTVIFSRNSKLTPGSNNTKKFTKEHNKHCIVISMDGANGFFHPAALLADFITVNDIHTLNVAGSRESKCPGIYAFTKNIVEECILRLRNSF